MKPSPKKLKETKEIYHTVVEHLIEEGYATDSDSADNIIKGMSDEWFETIIVEEDEKLLKARKKSIGRLNANPNVERTQEEDDYENPIDHSNPITTVKKVGNRSIVMSPSPRDPSGYMEVPTDYRARKRRASGR